MTLVLTVLTLTPPATYAYYALPNVLLVLPMRLTVLAVGSHQLEAIFICAAISAY